MIFGDKDAFIDKSSDTLSEVFEMLSKAPEIELSDIDPKRCALIIVDMINGFAREGPLRSDRVEALIPEISRISEVCSELGIAKIAFADSHTHESPEFGSYPEHCISGTSESDIVDEIRDIGGYVLIPKNSTNGFHESEFAGWLIANEGIDTFIIVGDCTDICIQQLAVTLKTWFNMRDIQSRVVVPINAVDTYDLGIHDADLMNVMALMMMSGSGVEVVSRVRA